MTASKYPPIDLGQVELPPEHLRQVVQYWKMVDPPAPNYRSIEIVSGVLYMVTRFFTEDGRLVGGNIGFRLVRVSHDEYRLTNGGTMVYRITEEGDLLGMDEGEPEPTMRCVPVRSLPLQCSGDA